MPFCRFLIIFLIWCPVEAFSQHLIKFNNITYEEGLSQSAINCMLQDKEGIIWLGTQGGLNYYDGYSIRSFQQEPGNPKTLSDDNIQCLAENEDGRLLIGTMGGGLNVFNKGTEQFERYSSSDSLPLLPDNTIWTILTDSGGTIWTGTNRGLARINLKAHTSKTFEPDTTGIGGYIFVLNLSYDASGKFIWMGTSNGLYLFDPANEKIEQIPGFEKLEKSKRTVWKIAVDISGTVWMGTDSGLISYDPDGKNKAIIITHVPGLSDQVVWSVLPSEGREIWLGTNSGLILYKTREGTFQKYIHAENDPKSLANDVVWSLMVDRSGIIWSGTGNGLSSYDPLAFKFNNIDPGKFGCSPGDVNAILEDSKENLWIGTSGKGLFRINLRSGLCEVLKGGRNGLTSDQIWALLEDHHGRIWVGTYGGGLCCLEPGSESFISYQSRSKCESCISNDRVFALEEDPEGIIWIGTRNGGLCRFDPETKQFKCYLNDPSSENSLAGDIVLSLKASHDGHLWVGTYGKGLSCFDKKTGSFINFHSGSHENRQIPDNNIWSILLDQKQRLWLGTSTGICLIPEPLKSSTFYHLGNQHGLPKGVVMGLVQDQQKNIWMSTFSGLSKMNMDSLEKFIRDKDHRSMAMFRNYSTDEGLQSNGFGQGAYFSSEHGNIYFGGVNGVNRFRADQVLDNSYLPDIRITSFKILNQDVLIDPLLSEKDGDCQVEERDGKYYLPKTISYIKTLKISSKYKFVSFEFSSLHFSRPSNNRYAYMLENFDPVWNYTGNKHDATYTNLPPGNYILKIRATNSDGIWSPDAASLNLIVLPLFHQTTLFLVMVGVSFLLIIITILLIIIRSHRIRAQRDQEFSELQLKTIKNQIDPHFTFNVINTVAGMIYKGNPDRTYDYFSRFAKLIRTSLDNSDRLKVTLAEEVDFVKNYLELEKARFSDDLEFSIHIAPDVKLDSEVPKMIIQIFAENAMKHGLKHKKENKRLSIRIYNIEQSLILEIEDNGIGRKEAAELQDHTHGKGYEIITKLTELYRQLYNKLISFNVTDLYNDDGTSAGTRVEVVIR